MQTGTIYRVDGSVEQVAPANGKDFQLAELQTIVGGTIDLQGLPKTKEIMVLNDNGKLLGLPVNPVATEVWKKAYPIAEYPHNNDQMIVGDVLVCSGRMVR